MLFKPLNTDVFCAEQLKMWEVLKPRIDNQIHRLSIPDLLLFCYLLGLNHMQDTIDKDTPP